MVEMSVVVSVILGEAGVWEMVGITVLPVSSFGTASSPPFSTSSERECLGERCSKGTLCPWANAASQGSRVSSLKENAGVRSLELLECLLE